MAIASESKVVSARKRRHVVEVVEDENENEVVDASEISKAKRTSCPGVRVKGNRIYDSENGKTCHQVFFPSFFFFYCLVHEKMWESERKYTFKFKF